MLKLTALGGGASLAGAQTASGQSSDFADILSVDPSNYPNILLNLRVDTAAGRNGKLTQEDFRIVENDVERAIKSFDYTSASADIAFLFDDTGSMGGEISAMKSGVKDLTDMIENRGIGARYALISFKDRVETHLGFTTESDELKNAVDGLSADGGVDSPEDNFDAIETALGLTFRPEAQKVVIDITDSLSHYRGDGSDFSEYTFEEVASDLATGGITYIAVAPDIDDPNASKKTLANELGGLWIDIASADFSAILDEITEVVVTAYVLEYLTNTSPGSTGDVGVTVDDPDKGTETETGTIDVPDDVDGRKPPADLDLTARDVTTKPGGEATIELSLTNNDENPVSNPAFQTRFEAFPDGWETVDISDGGGSWNASGRWTTGRLRPGQTKNASFTFAIPSDTNPDKYTATADALDRRGTVVDTDSATITVEQPPADLDLTAQDVTVQQGGEATIKFSLTNNGGNTVSDPAVQTQYRAFPDGWTTASTSAGTGEWNDSGKWTTGQLRSGKTKAISFTLTVPSDTEAGEYAVTADALTTGETVVDTASATITVEKRDTNESPTAEFTYSPDNPAVGDEVTFDASESGDSDGTIAEYEWDLNNDGSYETSGRQATTSFGATGDQPVRLRVTDNNGDTNTRKDIIPIAEAPFTDLKQRKLDAASTIDEYAVTTLFDNGEQRQVTPILETLIRDTNQGKVDKEVTKEAIDRMLKAEGLTQETLAAVGPNDMSTLPNQEISLANDTVDFAFNIIIELLFLKASALLKSGADTSGFGGFSLDAGIESINSVVSKLVDWAYSRIEEAVDIELTLRSGAETVAQNVGNGSISSVRQAQAELDNVVDQALKSVHHLPQSYIEQAPDGGIEAGLNEVNTALQSSTIQGPDGLQGNHDGAVEASNEGVQRLTTVATTADEFLDKLETEINKYDIVDRSFQLAQADDPLEAVWNLAQIVLTVAGGIGKAVSNAIGAATGLFAIRSLQYNHYYSLTGIAGGQPPADKLIGDLGQMPAPPAGTVPRGTGSRFYNMDPFNSTLINSNQISGTELRQLDGTGPPIIGALKRFKQAILNENRKHARELFVQITKEYENVRGPEQLLLRQALAIQQVIDTNGNHRLNAHGYLQQSIATEFKRLSFNLFVPAYLERANTDQKKQLVSILDQLIVQEGDLSKRGKTVKKLSGSVNLSPSIMATTTGVPPSITRSDLPVKVSITTVNVGDSVAKNVALKAVSDAGVAVNPRTATIKQIKPNSRTRHEFQITGAKQGGHSISFKLTSSNAGVASEEVYFVLNDKTTMTPSSDPDSDGMPGWLPIAGGAGALGLGAGAGAYGYLRKDRDEQDEEESEWL